MRDPDSPHLREGMAILADFSTRIEQDIAGSGDLVQVDVRHAMYGAAVEQLRSLARRVDVSATLPSNLRHGRSSALAVLDGEHRLFDAARIRLWLAEDDGPASPGLDAAMSTFEELAAHPYITRASLADRPLGPTSKD